MVNKKRKSYGGAMQKFMESAKNFLQKSKLLSKIGNTILPMTGEFAPLAQKGLDKLSKAGYGKKKRMVRRRKGGALRSVGGALMAVGGLSHRAKPHKGLLMSRRLNPIRKADTSALQFRY